MSMRESALKKVLLSGLLVLALGLSLAAQAPDRYLDSVTAADTSTRLVAFDPALVRIEALAGLVQNKILDIPNLTIIGVYHIKQTGNFTAAKKFVTENGLRWFKFHVVSAEIGESEVFRKNACTPEFEQIARKADGVIFMGGPDIPPSIFGDRTSLLTSIEDPYRHYLELSAVFHFLGGSQDEAFKPLLEARPGFPVLGICLGFQSLNVGTGGTLIQDIWTEVYGTPTVEDAIALGPERWHNNPYRKLLPLDGIIEQNFHTLELGGNSKFVMAMDFKTTDHPRVLSSHHQAIKKLGKGLLVVATSRDGKIIEAAEHNKYPNVLGIQFHPENYRLWKTEPRYRQKPGDPLTSYNAILAGAPPSLEFNKAIWKWFGGRLVESHGK
jgi:putative glutamine amidotransferase